MLSSLIDIGGFLTIHCFVHQSGLGERSGGFTTAKIHDLSARIVLDRSQNHKLSILVWFGTEVGWGRVGMWMGWVDPNSIRIISAWFPHNAFSQVCFALPISQLKISRGPHFCARSSWTNHQVLLHGPHLLIEGLLDFFCTHHIRIENCRSA